MALPCGGCLPASRCSITERDASKVALVHLMHHLGQRGYRLFDIQQLTPHTESLGAIEISRHEYLRRLADSQTAEVTFGSELGAIASRARSDWPLRPRIARHLPTPGTKHPRQHRRRAIG